MSINKVILLGQVSKFQEVAIRTTQDAKKIANFTLTTSESWKDKNGDKKTKYENHRVVVYSDGLAKIVEKYVSQGSRLFIEGCIQTKKWTNRDGVDQYTKEIALQGFNSSLQIINSNTSENVEQQTTNEPNGIDDDIPF